MKRTRFSAVPGKLIRAVLITIVLFFAYQPAWGNPPYPPDVLEQARKDAGQLLDMRRHLDQSIWGPEVVAQIFEARFVHLWDRLLREDDDFAILGSFPFTELVTPTKSGSEEMDLGIRRTWFQEGQDKLSPEKWRELLEKYASEGYKIVHTEWHHSSFEPPKNDKGAASEFSMVIHAARENPAHRVIISALLKVDWAIKPDEKRVPVPETITVANMNILERHAPAAFQEVFKVTGKKESPLMLPLLVFDLNGDGLSEIVAGGQNMVIWNEGEGKFRVDEFLKDKRPLYDSAVLADFTGDGQVDLVAVDLEGYPLLFEGSADGRFTKKGYRIADATFKQPKVFTAGDIDGDGDVDLYIATYKHAYRKGEMPTPYYDANDGFPASLFRNDGGGVFTDITEKSGLAAKRFRRAYSGSLVDLDDDNDLDLIQVSDYAGLDMYLNDGHGHFTDVSDRFGKDRKFFGMGHTFADYDRDGALDMYIIGMSSTTARRLEQMGLNRPDKPEHNAMRKRMGYGNRLFLRRGAKFVLAPFNDQVARTGWSWGASSFDFDNDGDKDIYVTNGHVSGKSTKDYCTTFWRHDIYDEGVKPNAAMDTMFQMASRELRQADISWNGYEHKVLFMNRGDKGFVNTAFLFGVAFEYDARSVVTDDLDADGRVDLLVVEFKTSGLDRNQYTLHIYRNVLEDVGHWIGIRLNTQGSTISPIGATVRINTASGTQMTRVVTGDSFSAQHPAIVHFGLGEVTQVDEVNVLWPDGSVSWLKKPAIDRYYTARPPNAAVGQNETTGEGKKD